MGESALFNIHIEETSEHLPNIIHVGLGNQVLPPEIFAETNETANNSIGKNFFSYLYVKARTAVALGCKN